MLYLHCLSNCSLNAGWFDVILLWSTLEPTRRVHLIGRTSFLQSFPWYETELPTPYRFQFAISVWHQVCFSTNTRTLFKQEISGCPIAARPLCSDCDVFVSNCMHTVGSWSHTERNVTLIFAATLLSTLLSNFCGNCRYSFPVHWRLSYPPASNENSLK